jgi:hypothetical protein
MDTYQFPDSLLDLLKGITLADCVDTPCMQPWAISMISNAVNSAGCFPTDDAKSRLFLSAMTRFLYQLPASERQELFKACGQMINARRTAQQK